MNREERKKILDSPSYWVEKVNLDLYASLMDYMEHHNITKQGDLAEKLGISESRISQILNTGETNFSVSKLADFIIKVGKYPIIEFKDKEDVLDEEENLYKKRLDELSMNVIWRKSATVTKGESSKTVFDDVMVMNS